MVKNQGRKTPPRRPQQSRPPQQRRPSGHPQQRRPSGQYPQRRPSRQSPQARKQAAIRRKKIKKRKRIIFYTSTLVLLVAVGVVLSLTVFFKIANVTVTGKSPYEKEKIINVSGIKKGTNMFLLNKKETSKKICTSLPYVGSVDIQYKLPDTINIAVSKTEEKQVFKNGKGYVITDKNGKVLKIGVEKFDANLIEVKGADIKKSELGNQIEFKGKDTKNIISTLTKALDKNKIKNISQIDVSSKINLQMKYENRINIIIGTSSNLDKKLQFANAVLKKENERSIEQKGIIDLQYINSEDMENEKVYFRPQETMTKPNTTKAEADKKSETTEAADKKETNPSVTTEVADKKDTNPSVTTTKKAS